jgi:hypothetical protein
VESKDGALSSSVLWGGGSVVPTASTKVDGDTLIVTREQKNKEGKLSAVETITAKAEGDVLKLTTAKKNAAGKEDRQSRRNLPANASPTSPASLISRR